MILPISPSFSPLRSVATSVVEMFVLVQAFDGPLANAAQIAAAQIEQRFAFERIELQIDFEVFDFREAFYEFFVLRDFQAVGIDHQVTNGLRLGHFYDREKIGMESGFAAGKLYYVGMAFVANDSVQHFFNQRERAMLGAFRSAACVTHRAAQIAGVGQFDEREAGVLLVIGAQAAIVGATPLYRSVVNQWHFRLLDKDFAAAPVVIHVVGDQYAFRAVIWAALQQKNFVVLKNDLAFQFAKTLRADGQRYIIKKVRPYPFRH